MNLIIAYDFSTGLERSYSKVKLPAFLASEKVGRSIFTFYAKFLIMKSFTGNVA